MRWIAIRKDSALRWTTWSVLLALSVAESGVLAAVQGENPAGHGQTQQQVERRALPKLPGSEVIRERETALRKRAEEFYSLLQTGHWEQAEAYVSSDTKANFRNQQKSPVLGFQIDSVKVDRNGQDAVVGLRFQMVTQFSTTPVPMPQTGRWRLENGVWYAVIGNPGADGGHLAPFDQRAGHAASQPEQLKFKGHRFILGMIQPGQTKVARFPFTNVSDHVVTVRDVVTGCDCLKAKLEKKELKPGESSELAIEFNSTGFSQEYTQTVLVKTEPGDRTTYLTVSGYVVPPGHHQAPRPAAKGKPGR